MSSENSRRLAADNRKRLRQGHDGYQASGSQQGSRLLGADGVRDGLEIPVTDWKDWLRAKDANLRPLGYESNARARMFRN